MQIESGSSSQEQARMYKEDEHKKQKAKEEEQMKQKAKAEEEEEQKKQKAEEEQEQKKQKAKEEDDDEEEQKKQIAKEEEVGSSASDSDASVGHGGRKSKSGKKCRKVIAVANLIAAKSVLLERERASEEIMEKSIEVAVLKERNAHLKSRLQVESKAHFDKQLTYNNLNDLYDIF